MSAAFLYSGVVTTLGLKPVVGPETKLTPGVLVYPVTFEDAVLYIMESEFFLATDIRLQDPSTGAELKFQLPSQRAVLALIDKKTKQVVAKYGF